jgi:hypothetical protein
VNGRGQAIFHSLAARTGPRPTPDFRPYPDIESISCAFASRYKRGDATHADRGTTCRPDTLTPTSISPVTCMPRGLPWNSACRLTFLTQYRRALVLPHRPFESSTRNASRPSRCCSPRGRAFRLEMEAGDPGKQRCTDGTTAEEKPTRGLQAVRPPPPHRLTSWQVHKTGNLEVFPRLGSGPCACMPANSCRMSDCDWPPCYMLPLAPNKAHSTKFVRPIPWGRLERGTAPVSSSLQASGDQLMLNRYIVALSEQDILGGWSNIH